jgi:hypothetical protein
VNTNFSDITRKDLFKAKLNGEVVDFGLVEQDLYPQFIRKLVNYGLLQFYFQKEHKATLAYLRVHDEFVFSVRNDRAGSLHDWGDKVKVKDGDFIEFTEMMLRTNYTWNLIDPADNGLGAKQHTIFVDYDIHRPEERQAIYRRYNFGT